MEDSRKELMKRVLKFAIKDYYLHKDSSSKRGKVLFESSREYLFEIEDSDYQLSYLFICNSLEIDHTLLREDIKNNLDSKILSIKYPVLF